MENRKNRKYKSSLTVEMAVKNTIWLTFKGLFFALMVSFALSFVFVLLWVLMNSFKTAIDYSTDVFRLPTFWDFDNYMQVLTNLEYKGYSIWGMIGNTFIMLAIRMFCAATFPQMAAYVLARFDFKGKKLIEGAVYLSMIIPIVGTMAAGLNFYIATKMYNTWFCIFFMSSGSLGFGQMVTTTLYRGIDKSYAEAAYMDGASEWVVFWKLYYPQSIPLMLIGLIKTFIGTWNDYMTSYIYLPDHPTIALGVQQMQKTFVTFGNDYPVMFAGIVLTTIPVLIVYAFFAPKMLNNKSLGALK